MKFRKVRFPVNGGVSCIFVLSSDALRRNKMSKDKTFRLIHWKLYGALRREFNFLRPSSSAGRNHYIRNVLHIAMSERRPTQ